MRVRSFVLSPSFGVLVLSLATGDLAQAQFPIVNGEFDSDISGWELPADPEISFAVVPGEKLTIEGMVLAEPRPPGVACFMHTVIFDGLNCTGNRSFLGNVPLNPPGVWEPQSQTWQIVPPFVTARASLTMAIYGGTDTVSCNFDSLTLTSDSRSLALSEIPTVSPAGLLVLAILLVISAGAFIRRRARLTGSPGHDAAPRH